MRAGAKPAELSAAVSRKRFQEVKDIARGLQTLELFAEGRAAGIFLDDSFKGLELTDELIDMIRFIEGIELAVLMKSEGNGSCRVRMRSEARDVSELARKLGGGGHRDAAGATIFAKFDIAKDILQEEVSSYLRC